MAERKRFKLLCGLETVVIVAEEEAQAVRSAEGMTGCWPCKVVHITDLPNPPAEVRT